MNPSDHFIAARWIAGDAPALVDQAVAAAWQAASSWSALPLEQRIKKIQAVAAGYKHAKPELIEAISGQTGKPRWEAAAEVDAMVAKAAISIASRQERRAPVTRQIGDALASTRYVPIGLLAILGPFNMPGHLPNGHLMPALLAGNTVIFKPSELTPLVGHLIARIFTQADLPAGVFNLLQGGAALGAALVAHPDIDGVLFTGSAAAGQAIQKSAAGSHKLLALEMGGNNPLIVWDCADLTAAAYCIIQSAFITSGQRCSCARRLIVPAGNAGDAIIDRLVGLMASIRVGLYTDDPEPFMGTLISPSAAAKVLSAQDDLVRQGATSIVQSRLDPRSPALLHPGLIDVTAIARTDEEIFGPLLQVIRAPNFSTALSEAASTRYGLSAGLLSDRSDLFERFQSRIRAGVICFNRPLTGARSDLPFGGLGASGNHRPSAYFAADYCSDPVAQVASPRVALPAAPIPGMT